jgi:hypothetical protein
MKKSLLALAVLGAFAGVASAQSSVSMYGTIDLNGKYVKNDGSGARYSLSQDGINSSQLGFKGTEDLGGGLKAGFDLIAGVSADTGPEITHRERDWDTPGQPGKGRWKLVPPSPLRTGNRTREAYITSSSDRCHDRPVT